MFSDERNHVPPKGTIPLTIYRRRASESGKLLCLSF